MQKIERYGVIALVFLLVTILAVSLWGESKDGGLFFWKKDGAGSDKQAQADRPRPRLNANGQPVGQGPRAAALAAANEEAAQGQPAAGPGAGGQGAGALELSPENGDPLAVQAREQRLAQLQRRAELQAAAQNAVPTPGGLQPQGQVQPGAQPQTQPAPGAALAVNQPAAGQPGVEAVPVSQGTLVRPTPAPVERANVGAGRSYVVKSGDTLGEIARRELGSSARWTEIQSLNGNLDPKRLRAGMKINLPAGGAPVAKAAGNTPTRAASGGSRSYTIRSGDTLSAVAARELGSAERWSEIAALNPRLDPARLSVGAVIALPGGAAASSSGARTAALDERRSVAAGPRPRPKSKVQ